MPTHKDGDLRIWHIPQVPGNPFYWLVDTLEEATEILFVLSRYDWFQLQHGIKLDYASAQGLEVFEDGVWVESSFVMPRGPP